ncbi:MAG: dicarboxylate/amino acid:cation symporter [Acidobacteriota bacterium]|nr:dicarboxylate/amino acid:cation symporter [Acidobacteriota bacterium]
MPTRFFGTRASRAVALFGLLLYVAGIALAAHTTTGLVLRLAGLAVFAALAVQRSSITTWTFFSIVAGAELGADSPRVAVHLHVLAEIFLRLVRMAVAPLIFGSLTTGIAGHASMRSLGRIAWRTFLYFEVVTTFALLLGAVAIDISRAGESVAASTVASSAGQANATQPGLEAFLLNIFPENIAQAVAQNQILQVAVFAIFFGVALSMLPADSKAPLVTVLKSLTDTIFQITKIIMYFAPPAAGAAMAYTVGSTGLRTLLPLGKLLLTFYAAAAAFVLLVLLPIALAARVPLRRFLSAIGEPAAIGFATTTSEAALPLAMERMEEFGVPRSIVAFVIPSGYSFNMDGSSLYLAVAALFAAQVSGIHLSVGGQAAMLGTLMVTSKGIAGVPRAVLAILLGTAASFHLSTAAILMVLGIDALVDMGRTSLNVVGNCLASAVVSQWESRSSPAAQATEGSDG